MCEINPKHSAFYRLEFFTSDSRVTEEEWKLKVAEQILNIEMHLNARGDIRVHIHEESEVMSRIASIKTDKKAAASRENGKLGGRPRVKK